MRAFVDTSAIYALLDRSDNEFSTAQKIWQKLLNTRANLITTNYVLLETIALLQRRFGMEAIQDMETAITSFLHVQWVDEQTHQAGIAALLLANRKKLSLVDCVSFAVCRQLSLSQVFAFDSHFQEQGFRLLTANNH